MTKPKTSEEPIRKAREWWVMLRYWDDGKLLQAAIEKSKEDILAYGSNGKQELFKVREILPKRRKK